jgi:hypothetical protein
MLTSLSEALDRHVGDSASVYVTGVTHLIDFAVAHELARRRLHVIRRAIERGAIRTPVNYGDNATIAAVQR